MKKLLTILFVFASLASFGQNTNAFTGIIIKNSHAADSSGINKIWYNAATAKFRFWDGTGKHTFGVGAGGGLSTTLSAGHLFVGNVSNVATDVALSGDGGLSSAGALTITKLNGKTVTLGGNLTYSGAFNTTHTVTGSNTITWPNASLTVARIDAAQTFTGVQTFSSLPTIPATPSASTDAASKGYVDGLTVGPFSTIAPGYANLSGNANSLLKGSNTWIAPGTNGYILMMTGGAPTWVAGTSITTTLNPQSSNYTFVAGDATIGGNVIITQATSASASNFTIPPNASVPYTIGTQLVLEWNGTGQPSWVAGAGVTINSSSGSLSIPRRYIISIAFKSAINTWDISSGGYADQAANTVLAGPTSGANAQPTYRAVIEADLALTDITTGNATTSAHGFVPKGVNLGKFLRDDLTWQIPGGAGSTVFSTLSAAAATNTLDNLNYAQEWDWSTLAGTTGLKIASASTAAASNAQILFQTSLTGANPTTQTTYALQSLNAHTGTASTNVAGYFSASGGTTNYGLQVVAGRTFIGDGTNIYTGVAGLGALNNGYVEINSTATPAITFTKNSATNSASIYWNNTLLGFRTSASGGIDMYRLFLDGRHIWNSINFGNVSGASGTSFLFGQGANATGTPTLVDFQGAAHTNLSASAEATDVLFDLARTVQFATGAITTQRAVKILGPTYGFVGASTITNAYSLWVDPPVAGPNATITSDWAAGFNGSVKIVGGATVNGITSTGNITVSTAGNGLQVKEGSNATMGTATANGTTEVTVSTTAVTATSRIFIFCESGCSGVSGSYYISARTAGTSFGFKAAATDTGTVAWVILEPAP